MTRLRARAPRGERAYGKVPRNRGKNTTLLASMTADGMGPCAAVVGSTTKPVFESYVEQVLAPARSGRGRWWSWTTSRPTRGSGCENWFKREAASCCTCRPTYSPDLNPIEEAFSKVKALLRRAAARTRGALVEAIGGALDAITARDARGWFAHCGYAVGAQRS